METIFLVCKTTRYGFDPIEAYADLDEAEKAAQKYDEEANLMSDHFGAIVMPIGLFN